MAIDVERLKASADLVAVVGSYVALRKRGQEYKGLCPFHPDKNPSFYVVPAKRMCHCFACGWGGDVIDFVQQIEGVDFKAAAEKLGAENIWRPKAPTEPVTQTADRITDKPPPGVPVPDMRLSYLGGDPAAVWTYRDTDGQILGYIARYATPEGKEIRCWSWGRRGEGAWRWNIGAWNKPRPLYGLEKLTDRPSAPILIVEGEKAADAAQALLPLYAVLTWPGGAKAVKHANWAPLHGRKLLIWPDADDAGVSAARKIAEKLHPHCPQIKIVDTSGQPEGWDLADAELDGWTTESTIAWAKPRAHPYEPNPAPQAVEEAAQPGTPSLPEPAPAPAEAGPVEPSGRSTASAEGLIYINAAQVVPRAIRWLWKGRIPRGKVSIIAGDPGLGKSQVCAAIASIVTNGALWPVDRTPCEEGKVIILSAEDDPEDTIRPRLDAAGARIDNVTILQAVKYANGEGSTAERGFNLGEDLTKLRHLIRKLGDVRLVIIDPVSAYLGTLDSHKNAEVRAMLAPLTAMASETDCSILLVSHLTKGQAGSVLARIQGSMAFGAAARAVWGVTKDHDNPTRRLFMPMKNNLGRDDTGLAYSIESMRLEAPEDDEPIETSRVLWESEPVTISAEDAFSMHLNHEERTTIADAKEFLRNTLAGGPVSVIDIKKDAEGAGYSWITVKRANAAMKLKAEKTGFRGGWTWALPDTPIQKHL